MALSYLLRRLGVFVVVIWAAATINFAIPRLSPVNPVQEALIQLTSMGGASQGNMTNLVKSYEAQFGLDQPLWKQYVTYLWDSVRGDFGFSITYFPTRVIDMIAIALPWTVVLITVSTLITFVVGTVLGAIIAWPRIPGVVQAIGPPLLTLSAIPYYLLGLILVYLLAFVLKVFPLGGGYSVGTSPSWTLAFVLDAAQHAILPALSIVLADLGGWALSMRGMMITVQGEDYITLAEAKGLRDRRIFVRYGMRNAVLPQFTSLALAIGRVVSGAILVEVVFAYPGVGNLLYQAIRTFDYFVIYGIVFIVIVAIGIATLVLDLLLPVLDPRITY
jgi:peptide/nickel transport system permease protein